MLHAISIQNFGLIDRLSLEFSEGLNILTGETGAGKSIVIGALRIALGDRIAASQLRDQNLSCIIEAVFDISDPKLRTAEVFSDFCLEEDPALIIQRTYSSDGRNKIKVNGLSVTVTQLRSIGDHLVDFHGAHDHQMLLSPGSHKGMLDRLVHFGNLTEEYQSVYARYSSLQKDIQALEDLSSTRERELDLISHQIKELKQVQLDDSVCEEVTQAQAKVNNAEKLSDCVGQIMRLLEGGGQDGVSESLLQAFAPMKSLNQIDEQTLTFMESLEQVQLISDQLSSDLKDYAQGLAFDPREADAINAKKDLYDDIKKKYGPTLAEAKCFYDEIQKKYDLLVNLENNDLQLRKELKDAEKQITRVAQKITAQRKKAAGALKQTIEKELSELGIAKVKFEARISQGNFHKDGCDGVTFFINPNAGEELKPLAEIVSSGEAARVMLALKKALVKVDPIPVLIFDEIDAQIGGRLGAVTGKKLREISKHRQVILITHLPQIASFADVHFKVTKEVKKGRSLTAVARLNKEDRIKEMAKMMSGEKESQISVAHASDMLSQANH